MSLYFQVRGISGLSWICKEEKTRNGIHLGGEAVRTKTIETRRNECEKYLHIIHFPLSSSSKPLWGLYK